MDMSIEVDGLARLIQDIRDLGADVEKEFEPAIKRTTAEALRIIQDATPHGNGKAKGAWGMTFPEPLVGIVSTNYLINWFLEWGTGLFSEASDGKHDKYKIAPVRAKALAFQWAKAGSLGISTSNHHLSGEGGKLYDGKGRALFRSKAGNATINSKNFADLVVRRYVMHPGIKPVGMVRGNLPRIRTIFEENVQAAADRAIEQFTRGF